MNPPKAVSADAVCERLTGMRRVSTVAALCPQPTGYDWMGVHRATLALFPECTLELPQHCSNTLYSDSELDKLTRHLRSLRFEQVIFSGFPGYFARLASGLGGSSSRIGTIYHGFLAGLADNAVEAAAFRTLLELRRDGAIHKIAFNKKGLAEAVAELWGFTAFKIILRTPLPSCDLTAPPLHPPHIGVLASDQFRKNLHNQVTAALLVRDSRVHVTSSNAFPYLPDTSRLERHPATQGHEAYISLLGRMTINLHLSFAESWGQVTAESLAQGVPCLVANHSDVYDYDPALKQLLVHDEFDDCWAIKQRLEEVLPQVPSLRAQCRRYIESVNNLSDGTLGLFLRA